MPTSSLLHGIYDISHQVFWVKAVIHDQKSVETCLKQASTALLL